MARKSSRTRRTTAPRPSHSGRYTAPLDRLLRVRPAWHRAIGVFMIALGATLFAVNDFARMLPGGHSEGWALLAIVIAASSLWFFGAFDPPA